VSTTERVSRKGFLLVGALLTLAALALGSVRFARADWTGIPLDRWPDGMQLRVGPARCHEDIPPYTTETGRVIHGLVVDEEQYLSIVELRRGVPRDELAAKCLYSPFTDRPAVTWIAHFIPGDEGVALSAVNLVMMVAAVWALLAAIRAAGVGPFALAVAGTLAVVNFNTLMSGSGLLIEPPALLFAALAWWFLQRRREWLLVPLIFFAVAFKEPLVVLLIPIWLWARAERSRGRAASATWLPALASTVALAAGAFAAMRWSTPADATWPANINLSLLLGNLTDPVGIVAFALATVPLGLPAFLRIRDMRREQHAEPDVRHPLLATLLDPAVAGVAVAVVLCVYAAATADLSPRIAWVGFPFAATLAAQWVDRRVGSPGPAGRGGRAGIADRIDRSLSQ